MPLDVNPFEKALHALEKRATVRFTSFAGSSLALFFSMIPEPSLLLCHSEDAASELYEDASFWSNALGGEQPLLIPPRDDLSRLKNLSRLYTSGAKNVIAPVEGAFQPVWQRGSFPLIKITKGSTEDRDEMIERLSGHGYKNVSIVSGQGELSIRGGILDVFPPESELPVRIEFFGDEIESLRFFDIATQRTAQELEEVSFGPAEEPADGPHLIDVLTGHRLIVCEPDDISRHHSSILPLLQDKKHLSLTSLPETGEGWNVNIRGTGGLGLLREERRSIEDFALKVKELRANYFILLVCSAEGQAKRLRELCLENDLDAPIRSSDTAIRERRSPVITTGILSRGFQYNNTVVLSERDIFGKKPGFRALKRSQVSRLVHSMEDFKEGDLLVHSEQGIGKFLGLRRQVVEDYEGDCIVIEYLGGDRLYVPLERINCIQKYHAPEGVRPKIDRLGGRTWQRTRRRVKQKIQDMAKRLISLYARRSTASGHAFSEDTELHREFDGFFLYEETPDQLTSISEIKRDMESPTPMDRLLCGDVGYGKTEVAMRACFKAVYDSKQVAFLVPTTILSEQHFDTFTSRFSAFPVRIDFLSRFKSRAEQKKTLKALAGGDIDIIIGTHRLLARDVQYYNLGLLVIDEEHKFGVTHKERIKSLTSKVDVLTLSATPIPRTLHMALSGIRAMSVIETAPEERLSVKSFVARFDPEIIRSALQKELDRNGQAFFVHNRIRDIHSVAQYLQGLVPECKIGVAHGRMKERELEEVMRSFLRKERNILVSTAIIGSGLDIPTANTIIINRADTFGLADLYQLRGRVGRSNIRAFSYFLIPGEEGITEQARKKLQAIQELGYLGAGFRLAMRDLEIRGAGNLLGQEQSGHIEAIGFDLYVEMLEQTVAELKGERVSPKIEPLVDLKITALIPEEYISNPDIRLSLYRKIASAKDKNHLTSLYEELRDRFGAPPDETQRLLEVMELKAMAKKLAVTKIVNAGGKISCIFAPETPVTPEKLLSLYRKRKEFLRLLPEGGIEINLSQKRWGVMFEHMKGVLEELSSCEL